MAEEKVKFRLKGHESFQIREGWLRKGMKSISDDSGIFSNDNASDTLGVGTNMVKAIRFWLQAAGLTKEKTIKGGKREQILVEGFGDVINHFDPYFEDIFTLWLIHYKLATNKELATSWYMFFNEFHAEEFTKEQMGYKLKMILKHLVNNAQFSERTLMDDCDCIIKTYLSEKDREKNPEDNTICPLTELELLDIASNDSNQYYLKKRPSMSKLDKLVVLYIILDNLNNSNSTSIDNLLNNKCNVGKVLNLDRNMLNEYLDLLKNDGYIEVNRTAGLDKIYVKTEIANNDVLRLYYNQQ